MGGGRSSDVMKRQTHHIICHTYDTYDIHVSWIRLATSITRRGQCVTTDQDKRLLIVTQDNGRILEKRCRSIIFVYCIYHKNVVARHLSTYLAKILWQ